MVSFYRNIFSHIKKSLMFQIFVHDLPCPPSSMSVQHKAGSQLSNIWLPQDEECGDGNWLVTMPCLGIVRDKLSTKYFAKFYIRFSLKFNYDKIIILTHVLSV